MKSSGLIIIFSIFLVAVLLISGAYITVDNIFNPKGYLFEGVVVFSLGFIMTMILVVINSLGLAIETFSKVFEHQVKMQQTITEHLMNKNNPSSLGDLFQDLSGPTSSISITNLETGETITNPIGDDESILGLKDVILNIIRNKQDGQINNKEIKNMNREQLEEELAVAVKNEDFEKADEIKKIIQKLDENS